MSKVITRDESWLYDYDTETKPQSSEQKILFLHFTNCAQGACSTPGKIFNREFYYGILKRLKENVRCKQPDMLKIRDWMLHHKNALIHTSLKVRDFLIKNNMITVYLPDLAL